MKTLIVLAALAITGPVALAETVAKKAEAYYRKGLAAEKAGDPTTARAAYNAALELRPDHADARFRAGQVKINAASIKSTATEAKIGSVEIPVYQVDDSTVAEAIEVLSLAMDKATGGKVAPNFVIDDPKGKLAERRISMQLKNIPVKEILTYIHSQAGTKARYDEYAVVIKPL